MIMSKGDNKINQDLKTEDSTLTASQKRRIRRKRLQASRAVPELENDEKIDIIYIDFTKPEVAKLTLKDNQDNGDVLKDDPILDFIKLNTEMSSKQVSQMRDDVIAAREAKKLAKQKAKNKNLPETNAVMDTGLKAEIVKKGSPVETKPQNESPKKEQPTKTQPKPLDPIQKVEELKKVEVKPEAKSKDEVDRAIVKTDVEVSESDKSKEQVKADRAAKKAAKQAKKKGAADGDHPVADVCNVNKDITVKDVVDTLNDIVNVAKEVQEVTAKVKAIDLETKKPEETKSKAELKAARRAKQEAQRAAKQAAQEKATPKPSAKPEEPVKSTEEKSPKQKPVEKPKKPQSVHRANWFQHLYNEHDKESLKKIPINSNLHPAIVKLGVQLASRVVTGSNARCIALLDALKKMVRDYTLPARTEFARGLEAHLASSVEHLCAMRRVSASQTNALNYFRHQLTQLPNNVDEFDAKKTLQEGIDTYIREQIDKAGEAISIAVRNKISNGDNILTYGCSSLIERILREAWEAGVQFRAVVVGQRVNPAAKEMLRRLVASHVPCTYMDITALNFAMNNVSKVVLGASSVLVNGSVVTGAGGAQAALAARARNVPVLVACETHKFADLVHTDAFVYNEIGDPDDLIDQSDENSPLKDWRSNPNLTPLNLTYDITPPSLVTAVVTELAILPCTSAPVVLRFKLSEYGV